LRSLYACMMSGSDPREGGSARSSLSCGMGARGCETSRLMGPRAAVFRPGDRVDRFFGARESCDLGGMTWPPDALRIGCEQDLCPTVLCVKFVGQTPPPFLSPLRH
jgi:hypothetical protein